MSPSQKHTIIAAVAVAVLAAVPIGLQWQKIRDLEAKLARRGDASPTAVAQLPTATSKSVPTTRSTALSKVVKDLESWEDEIAGLSTEEFGEKLAELLGSGMKFPDSMAQGALMLHAIDPETALATSRIFRENRGMGQWEDSQILRAMLKTLGEKSGREGLDAFFAEHPEGFSGLSSYMHGWTLTDQEGSLAWANALPEDSKFYKPALNGIFWSAGVSGPEFAAEAFASLDPETMDAKLLNSVGNSMGNALMTTHGVEGVDAWVDSLPETMQTQAIGWALDRADSQPVSEVATWLAKHAHRSEDIAETFVWGVEEWSRSSSDAAMEWAVGDETLWETPAVWVGISEGAGPGHMVAWVEQNPTHPAAESLRAWLYPKDVDPALTE